MASLKPIIDHAVLPPKLPGEKEENYQEISDEILRRLIRACEKVESLASLPFADAFHSLSESLQTCMNLNQGRLDRDALLKHFSQLRPNTVLICYVVEQNAAVFIRLENNHDEQFVVIECFETSPTTEHVLAADNALEWDFPGRAVRLSLSEFNDENLQKAVSTFLECASMEKIQDLQAQTNKASVSVAEIRDTSDPAMITQMFMSILEAIGEFAHVPQLRKRVRDDVNFVTGSLPWRRLPFWLVLQVAAQRHLHLSLGEPGRACYKLLMAVFFSELLHDATNGIVSLDKTRDLSGNLKLDPSLVLTLRTKLCRRMAKLEQERANLVMHGEHFESLFSCTAPMITTSIEFSNDRVGNLWNYFKWKTKRKVHRLPQKASDRSLQLSLMKSGSYLDRLLDSHRSPIPVTNNGPLLLPNPMDTPVQEVHAFTEKIFLLTRMEQKFELVNLPNRFNTGNAKSHCCTFANNIHETFRQLGEMYDGDPLLQSIKLLTIFELWMRMDECALVSCPLLGDYQPVFPPELLDALQLPSLTDMQRLLVVQTYLANRHAKARHGHIFSVHDQDSFAVQYAKQSEQMKARLKFVMKRSDADRTAKTKEWESKRDEYETHSLQVNTLVCQCTFQNGKRDVRGCTKCWHWRTRKKLRIQHHEDFLPTDEAKSYMIVFELEIPKFISDYRDATWKLFRDLAHPTRPSTKSPYTTLDECRHLQGFMTAPRGCISLASDKKCFSETHYSYSDGLVSLKRILLPFAANFQLYDHEAKIWVKDLSESLTLHHLCRIYVPLGLSSTVLKPDVHPATSLDGPSSYEIQANTTKCPPSMSVAEFSAYQKLLAGKSQRWLNILVELGSWNVNFSSEDTALLVSQLAIQAGPATQKESGPLRDVHSVFRERHFVQSLKKQIQARIDSIYSNWRETNCMELLINLSLRGFSLLLDTDMRAEFEQLLRSARDATLGWIMPSQEESRNTLDGKDADRIATYGLKASLLCRRTFEIHLGSEAALSAADLSTWIKASVALQENRVMTVNNLSPLSRSMMIRDAKMMFRIDGLIRAAVEAHPDAIADAIGEMIDIKGHEATGNETQSTTSWTFLQSPHSRWIRCTVPQNQACSRGRQVLHLHILEGHFFVNGKRRGNLPLAIRNDPSVKSLFGDQNLHVYASSMPGMEYTLAYPFQNKRVHFGMRESGAIIRTEGRDGLFEFIPSEVFKPSSAWNFDLPRSLLDNCSHWLNLDTGILEIRRQPSIWNRRHKDWVINVFDRYATRGERVNLVDPCSSEFKKIAKIFEHFEVPQMLTVFQSWSERGRLSVELRHLDLEFHVNSIGLLFCKQLKANIDIDQDAGTWYGLASKIVLRDAADTSKRSIIIPNGKLSWRSNPNYPGIHVDTFFQASDRYFRFDIDQTLGRLVSQPEPLLLCRMALCHAVTSFCLPDPLTGVTGTEEAVRILQSGAVQPWSPSSFPDLGEFAVLLPKRQYYPPEFKRLQRVKWDSHLTTTIQSDQLEALIREIERKAGNLAQFSQTTNAQREKCVAEEASQLRLRAQARRSLYERTTTDTAILSQLYQVYVPRDRQSTSRGSQVYQVAQMIHSDSQHINMGRNLKQILDGWPHIGGFMEDILFLDAESLASQMESRICDRWGSLIKLCCSEKDKPSLIFQLGLLAFQSKANMDIVLSLVAFYCIRELRDLEHPKHAGYERFRERGPPQQALLEKLIHSAFLPCPETNAKCLYLERQKELEKHMEECVKQGKLLAKDILAQWPELPDSLSFETSLIDVPAALDAIRLDWNRRKQNDQLEIYVDQVDSILIAYRHKCGGRKYPNEPQLWERNISDLSGFYPRDIIPSFSRDLVTRAGPDLVRVNSHFAIKFTDVEAQSVESQKKQRIFSEEPSELDQILDAFSKSPNTLRQDYSSDLQRSLAALQSTGQTVLSTSMQPLPGCYEITHAIEQLRGTIEAYQKSIRDAFWSGNTRFTWLTLGDILPCRTPIEILCLLQSRANHSFGPGMKEALINYGCAIAEMQRLIRLRSAVLLNDHRAINEELRNVGHENWNPMEEDPDWLLIEIDSNILIRTDQIDVARAVVNPASGQNSVLQMNMGRGKTSCIMPMAAAILANGENVSRLIVPKSLIMQTANMMHSRLGGLVGREICHIPFSRQTPTTDEMIQLYERLHRDVQRSKGLILTSHEHVLSFRLSGLQRLADDKTKTATMMINFQNWLDTRCRDILDECDFTLSPRTQLNYPSGSEKDFDGHPFRWQVAEGLLSMVSKYIPQLRESFPGSIELLASSGWFPAVQFLRNDVEDELHRLIVDDISKGKAPFLYINHAIDNEIQTTIKRVLSDQSFDTALFEKATGLFPQPDNAAKKLLVIRGIVTRKILLLCLSKRWNVQYGLHPGRIPLAVPFAAKGVPSELSEFGHPDVTILLTCLSFYSAGLSYEQFRQALQSMLASEDAASEYEKWISECNIPPHLQHWNLINLENETQVRLLWKFLCRTQAVANYYMNKFVFQPYARQFTIKLQASAWDIPQNSGEETAPAARTTGFSGTNDNKYLMPMNVEQEDLPGLLQTNAEVLSYLLQPRNRKYSVLVDHNLWRLSEHDMLKTIHDQGIRILIDSGAYILETGNRDLAKLWLQVDGQAQAAVYFHSDNRAWVVYRDPAKRDTPLLATRLANNLENCLVYFDEAHTRGVDLKLPENARAALTLALKQTKDNTMQAAMRLRQLRTTQSVMFFAPPEVDMSIRDVCYNRLPINTHIESPHVIFWLLEQTCRANEDLQPLFQAQGNDFCRRTNALLKYPDYLTSKDSKRNLLKILQQPEHQTLMQMYGDTSRSSTSQGLENMLPSRLQGFTNRLSQYDISGVYRADIFGEVEQEQERELEVQLETQRETERPVHYQALNYLGLSATILDFYKAGKLNTTDKEIRHAFDYIGATEVGEKHDIKNTDSRLFVSKEFGRTIKLPLNDPTVGDRFLRPVEWVLWSPSTWTALVIIPEEAELLIPKLRVARGKAKVHLIAYAAPITRAMVPFNHLRYYSLPPVPLNATFPVWLKVELGILSGRLYADFEEWKLICDYFKGSPKGNISRGFLLEWLGVRCRAHDVLHTPMGYICLDRTATEMDPFFVQNATVATPAIPAIPVEDTVEETEEEKWEEEESDDEEDSLYVDETKDGSVEKYDSAEEDDSSEENDSDEEDGSDEESDSNEEYEK
ncbi:hypothetical protein M431DRAFT_83309 [Trichoderma harzianum CBS 226.95]|uniref:ubiquitinyl hydrolase 1 n=1 Tax=Trichoderma harzianum CBS 226.95 TaxID=983964 RepID=A0A2T4AEH9_TRIHA|nr:hypothetical protein M431DRAFT_83309 [Trichoderma harzianum CBS 226.95]PTB55328.1 hypothetical protein M431DRAFT_83309 [Trichoderma harzianum CBS 226.95]